MSNGKTKQAVTRFGVAKFITNYVEELDAAYHLTDSSSLTEDSDAQKALGLGSTGLIVAAARRSFFRQEALAKIFRLLPRESKVLLVCNGSAFDLVAHILAVVSGIPAPRIHKQLITDNDWPKLPPAIEELCDADYENVQVCESTSTLDAVCDEIKSVPRGTFVFIDNIHLISSSLPPIAVYQRLRETAQALHVTVIVGVGLSHWVEVRHDKRATLRDLAEHCSGVEHVADRIIIMDVQTDPQIQVTTYQATVYDCKSMDGTSVSLESQKRISGARSKKSVDDFAPT
ncbi:DnaB-like helicase C-terminal domain-containing protein [Paraburkholderia sp.]|uniref:DnaB-like helicase C-terminal domain-containing protein n=1 Tax=Paraburkholderia sp. TaxID=1926495 RepID=UPI003D6DEFB5